MRLLAVLAVASVRLLAESGCGEPPPRRARPTAGAERPDLYETVVASDPGVSKSLKVDDEDRAAPAVFVSAFPPVEVGRSLPGEDLLDPSFMTVRTEGGSTQLLVTASSSLAHNSSRTFAADANTWAWSEVSPALRVGNASVGVCLPATRTGGTICMPVDASVERDASLPASAASRAGLLRSSLLVADASGGTSMKPHPALVVDMSNANANISFTDPFRPQSVIAADQDGELLMLLIGRFDVPTAAPPPPGCRATPKSTVKVPATSLVTVTSADGGLHWKYRSTVPLQPPASTTLTMTDAARDHPVCTPACPKGTVCSTTSGPRWSRPQECVSIVCKPACKACEVCDNGRCVAGEVHYVTSYAPVLVGVGAPNGTAGETLQRPQLHEVVDQDGNTTVILSARTGGDANASRHFALGDSNGEVWSEVGWWNESSLLDGVLAASPVCFAAANGSTLCAGRRLHRNTSVTKPPTTPAQELSEERSGFLLGGSFQLVHTSKGVKGKGSVQHVGTTKVEVQLPLHNITAGSRQLVDGQPVQLFDADLLGTPATADKNGTLVQLLAVAWDVNLGSCLHAQNKYCLTSRVGERHSSTLKAGECASCLADHMTELVGAGCNDTDAALFCSTPGPTFPGKRSLVLVASTDSGRHWNFRSQLPPFSGFNASAPNDGWPLGMGRDPRSAWTCSLPPLAGDLVAVEGGPLFAAWQPEKLTAGPDPGSRAAQQATSFTAKGRTTGTRSV